jgi:hypothetical protein
MSLGHIVQIERAFERLVFARCPQAMSRAMRSWRTSFSQKMTSAGSPMIKTPRRNWRGFLSAFEAAENLKVKEFRYAQNEKRRRLLQQFFGER